MRQVYLYFLLVLILGISNCMFPWTKKNKAVQQMDIIKEMSEELKHKSELLPTPEDISNKIHKVDKEFINHLNQEIINEENMALHKPHVCDEPNYARDYSYLCPQDWEKTSSDQCWGENYDGHCESLKYFQDYSDEEKKEFELNCCVLWPELKKGPKRAKRRADILRGSINANNGLIIKPRNM